MMVEPTISCHTNLISLADTNLRKICVNQAFVGILDVSGFEQLSMIVAEENIL